MADKSSYLQYLPPVLWENEPPAPAFSLGATLRIFEKLLTGIADDVPAHPPLTAEIAELGQRFDPWRTPEPFLPWLASWVALEFPTLQDTDLWDEYQRRKVTAEIAQIYRLRGLKAGLDQYLDLYAVGETRPRVAIDDGRRLLMVTPRPSTLAPVAGLVTQGPVVTRDGVLSDGLVRPSRLAAALDGTLFVGDDGVPESVPVPLRIRVWRIGPDGRYGDLAGTPPRPQPLATDTTPNASLVGVAVRPGQAARPETLYFLNSSGRLFAIPAPYRNQPVTPVTSLATAGTTHAPVALAADGNGDLLVLDRGDGGGTPNPPKIITVQLDPLKVTRTPLRTVIEPLSLLVEPDGSLIVGDGREQRPAGPAQFGGNLVRVDRTTATWTETLLLGAGNPLVAPTGLARTDDGRLYALDAGLKPFNKSDSYTLAVAEPAGIFQIDLEAAPPAATRATPPGQLVYPTGLVSTGNRLVACDPGQPPALPDLQPFWSRLRPFQFNVVIHFTDSRLPTDPALRTRERRRAVGNIRTIVDQQKPAHTHWDQITKT
jgi:phage tail-like protein